MSHHHTQECVDRRGFKLCGQTAGPEEEWKGDRGLRLVVGAHDGRIFASTEGTPGFEIFAPADLAWQIRADAANAASRARQTGIKTETQLEAEALTRKRNLHGFTKGMPPVKARKIEEALDKIQGFNREFLRRRDFIERDVAQGAHITVTPAGERRLIRPSGAFYTERDITKTAMDYAEFLLEAKTAG